MNPLILVLLSCWMCNAAHPPQLQKHPKFFGRGNITEKNKDLLKKSIGDLDARREKLTKIGAGLSKKRPMKTMKIKQPSTEEHEQVVPLGNNPFEINQNLGVDEFLYDGDVNPTDAQFDELVARAADDSSSDSGARQKRQFTTLYQPWTNCTVYYYFDAAASASVRSVVPKALAYIQARTCLKFIESSTATNRIRVFPGAGCYSSVSMIGGEQSLSLGTGCEWVGIAAHEFIHALGSWHEQSRYDRDDYVTLDMTYVDPGKQYNFDKETAYDTINYNPYEYGSVMQYSASSFTQNGQVSMWPKKADYLYTMGGEIISHYDIYMISRQYNCFDKCPAATSAVCTNGGFPNPNNCAVCVCPGGYGGALCDQRPPEYPGTTMAATTAWQKYTVNVGDYTTVVREDYTWQVDWITAPAGKQIEVGLTDSIYNSQCNYGCPFAGIEFKVDGDKMAAGPRFCCSSALNQTWVSWQNPTPIIFYNNFYTTTATVRYRYVDALPTTSSTPTTPTTTVKRTTVTTPSDCTGHWSEWTDGTCSDTCGMFGVNTQTRDCLGPTGCTMWWCMGISSMNVTCPEVACLLPRQNCAAGYKKYPDMVKKQIICVLDTAATTPLG